MGHESVLSLPEPTVEIAAYGLNACGNGMRNSTKKNLSLGLLILVLIGNGVFACDAKRLAHAISHGQSLSPSLRDHNASFPFAAQGERKARPLSAIEHQLLHAAEHIQTFVANRDFDDLADVPARIVPGGRSSLALPQAEAELPFRPPRLLSSL